VKDPLSELKRKSVLTHRILMMTGSMGDITGHVFVRVPGTNEFLVRCRNDSDWSPGFMTPQSLHRFDLDGNPTEDVGDWLPPPERFIGSTIFKARPDIDCVVHGHPPAQIMCGIAGVPIRPIINTAIVGGMNIGLGEIPVYPRSILIASEWAGKAVLAVMGNQPQCLLKHHGNVVVGSSIEEATLRSIRLEETARLCWQMELAGKQAPSVPWEDVDEFNNPTQPASQAIVGRGGPKWVFDYYAKMLQHKGQTYAPMEDE
jgi:ribulose-5-phosphate 4-epimerase/fuculose-1-phosphate aldolase